jgi:K+-transporting ATPase ATPase C chain
MRRELLTALRSMVVITVVLGLGYPLVTLGVGQLIFPGKANGSLIHQNGRLVGSSLIGQQFYENVIKNGKVEMKNGTVLTAPDPRYFQTRPSGTVPADNAAATAFANYGPNSILTKQAIEGNIASYLALNKPYDRSLNAAHVPVDAADTSASGIDPDISVANALIQARRVAAVRQLALASVDQLVAKYTTGRSLGFLGEPGVNVLELNLALDRASTGGK